MPRIFESPKAPWLILALTFVITLSGVRLGFYNDDHALRAALSGNWPHGPKWWDLYSFATGDLERNRAAIESGVLPWWTAPGFQVRLVRPLASALFAFDHAVFKDFALAYHLHSSVWYLALVASVGLLFRTVLPRATANLAMLVYALAFAHFYPWAWVSCRHMLVASVPCVLGIVALLRHPRAGPWLFALGYAVGLTAGETALGAFAFLLCHVGFDLTRRFVSLLPAAGVSVLYLVGYKLVGGGAAESDGYLDPAHSPVAFATKACAQLPMLLGNAILAIPSEVSLLSGRLPLIALGLIGVVGVAWLVRASANQLDPVEQKALPWLVVAGVVACVPSLGAFPGGRILLLPDVGFAALIAVLLRRGFSHAGWLRRGALAFLAFVHLVASPLLDVGQAFYIGHIARRVEEIAESAETGPGQPRAFVFGTSDPMVNMYVPAALADTARHRLSCWSTLSGAKRSHRITRTGNAEIVLRPLDGALVREPFETLFRSVDIPFRVGDEARQCGAVYRVTAIEAGRPTEVRVSFDRPLEDPSLRFLAWRSGRLVAAKMPAVGESMEIPWTPGPLGSF
jgi:hypothetical protein